MRRCFRQNVTGLGSTVTVTIEPLSWGSTCHSQSAYEGLSSSDCERYTKRPAAGSSAETRDLLTQDCPRAWTRTFHTDSESRRSGASTTSVIARFHSGSLETSVTRLNTASGAAPIRVLTDSRLPMGAPLLPLR